MPALHICQGLADISERRVSFEDGEPSRRHASKLQLIAINYDGWEGIGQKRTPWPLVRRARQVTGS
jgi:hypothetical protein